MRGLLHAALIGLVLAPANGCGPMPRDVEPDRAVERGEVGRGVLALRWRFELDDRSEDSSPQEFASPLYIAAASSEEERIYVGNKGGWFYALDGDGEVVWKRKFGSVSSQPTLVGGHLYIGTDDGSVVCATVDGEVRWRYTSRGSVTQSPVVEGDVVIFSNEADHVYALDRATGEFRWQYKIDTPEEFTLRGHAGVTVSGDLALTGFANGTVVALRVASGSVAWLASLKGDEDRFVDVDVTPVVVGQTVYSASSAGGIHALDLATGLVRWRTPVRGVGGLASDGERLYAAAAQEGFMALDLDGHVLWRQGTRGGGEPTTPVVTTNYVVYALASAGLFVADKQSGEVWQYFDPGYGISSRPAVGHNRVFLVSNSAYLYAMNLLGAD